MEDKETVLAEADRLVSTDRREDYGHPWDNFSEIAALWKPILGVDISPEKVALCMIQVKLS